MKDENICTRHIGNGLYLQGTFSLKGVNILWVFKLGFCHSCEFCNLIIVNIYTGLPR